MRSGSKLVGIATAFCVILLSACVGGSVRDVPVDGPGPVASAPRGVEGDWFDRKGIRSSFNGGVFETRTTDTNQKLAEGSYTLTDPRTVQITVVSLVRNTTSNVSCLLASQNQLNCTSSAGQQFVLTRRVPAA